MKDFRISAVLLLWFAFLSVALHAANEPVIVEAESGSLGSDYAVRNDGSVQYITPLTNLAASQAPGVATKVATYAVTFPGPGTYDLYARVRVGPGAFNDDSFYYGNGFGAKSVTDGNGWILCNNLSPVGYTLPTDTVDGGGVASNNVWKWIKLSAFNGGEAPISFTVSAGTLTQTFQIGAREDGLDVDKIAFGVNGVYYTVSNLDNGQPGSTIPPPPPYVPPGPPLATGQARFLGSVYSTSQVVNFKAYFNQVTPENGGKWGSVEATRDVMNWTDLDNAYALAKNNGYPFKMHALIWGQQQPAWLESLPADQQLQEIKQWFSAVAARYPAIDYIDVVNEPLHSPPSGPGTGNYINALGGTGSTGWDWVLNAFRLARQYFPNARLVLNEYSVENDTTAMLRYIGIVELLQDENLIDAVGVQGHAFSTRVPASTLASNLDLLAATGVPILISELDIDGPSDAIQLADYQRIFPTFWEHPSVSGITLWGYRPGMWRTAQGAYLVLANGAERPAMLWLKDYLQNTATPVILTQPQNAVGLMGGTVTFSVEVKGTPGLSRPFQWFKDGNMIAGATSSTLTLSNIQASDVGRYDVVVANGGGSVTSAFATLSIADVALVNHAPRINSATVAGSIRQLQPESVALSGRTAVSGDLLVPGTPAVRLNGGSNYGGTIDGTGADSPANYTVTLNGAVTLRHVIRRTDAVPLPAVQSPAVPTGTRGVVIDLPGQTVGDWTTVRDLTLNDSVGQVAVPAGAYGIFIANDGSGFTLGNPGTTQPAVYYFQNLVLNSGSKVEVAGPVIVVVANGFSLDGASAGDPEHPAWLTLNVYAGGGTLDDRSQVFGYVSAPSGRVTVTGNSKLLGGVAADGLTLNGAVFLDLSVPAVQ